MGAMPELSDLGLAALRLARIGLRVFPVVPRTKQPFAGSRGLLEATTDEIRIASWWGLQPDASVAIATGNGLVVVDIDSDEALRECEALGLPDTVCVQTGKGWHFYYQIDGWHDIRNVTGLLPGVDLRGEGGYVVAPPSKHALGREYRWEASPEHVQFANVPQWVIHRYREGREGARATTAPRELPTAIIEGGRNSALASFAGTMRKRGASESVIHAALVQLNREVCRPPLEEGEVWKVAHSVARYQDPEDLSRFNGAASAPAMPAGLDWPAISVPLPEVPWVCRDLHLAPGRPSLLTASAGAGKTWIAVDLAIAVASGGQIRRTLDSVDVQRFGRVIHLNFDFSAASTRRRYQRVAAGHRLSERGIVPDLRLWNRAELAGIDLVSSKAREFLRRELDGAALCVIDAMTGALPGVDLNDGRVRQYLDLMLEASDATGATFLLIHHDRKGQTGQFAGQDVPRQEKASGSAQIAAGCDVTLHVERAGPCWRVAAGKVSEGKPLEGGYLVELVDQWGSEAPAEGRQSPGVAFVGVSEQEAAARAQRVDSAGAEGRIESALARDGAIDTAVVAAIRRHPRTMTSDTLVEATKRRKTAILASLARLIDSGRIVNLGSKNRPAYIVPGSEGDE